MTSRHVAPSITPKRWAYLKSFQLGAGTMIHESCSVMMIPPEKPGLPSTPWVSKGVSFKYGPSGKPKRIRARVQKWMNAQQVSA